MKRIGFVLLAIPLTAMARPNQAESRFEAMLKRIDPSERLEQVCEYAALTRIGHDKTPYRPDRVVIDSVSPPSVDGDSMSGTGAALRSRGQWYRFAFTCKATPDRMKVESFSYRVGDAIPQDDWQKYGLWR
jgi:hypothetical protein